MVAQWSFAIFFCKLTLWSDATFSESLYAPVAIQSSVEQSSPSSTNTIHYTILLYSFITTALLPTYCYWTAHNPLRSRPRSSCLRIARDLSESLSFSIATAVVAVVARTTRTSQQGRTPGRYLGATLSAAIPNRITTGHTPRLAYAPSL